MALAKLARPNELVHAHLSLVPAVARRVRLEIDAPVEFDDLVGHGMVGLLEAAHRYDCCRGVTFVTFAFYRIRGAMLDAVRVLGRFTRREVALYRAGILAAEVEIPVPSVESLPDDRLIADELSLERDRLMTLQTALAKLPPKERLVLEKLYFEGQRLHAAAAELGLSKSWASRLHNRAVRRLRRLFRRELGD